MSCLSGSQVKIKMTSDKWEYVALSKLMDIIEKIIAEHHLVAQYSQWIEPAYQKKSISAAKKGTGKPWDILVDNLVIKVEEPKQGDGSGWLCIVLGVWWEMQVKIPIGSSNMVRIAMYVIISPKMSTLELTPTCSRTWQRSFQNWCRSCSELGWRITFKQAWKA